MFDATYRYIGRYVLCLVLLIGASFAGCGYHFRATGEAIQGKLESIAIPLMTSTSSEIGFEADFTGIIRDEFISHAKTPLVPRDRAQRVLIGHIREIAISPLTFDVQEYRLGDDTATYETTDTRRLKISLDIRMVDGAGGKTLWREENMVEKTSYKLGTDPLVNRFNRKQALERIARRMAKRIYLKTMERF